MGRYRRGHRFRKRGRDRKHNGGDMAEEDFALLEAYLLEYRSSAYDVHRSKRQESNGHQHEDGQFTEAPTLIGGHNFPPITVELVSRPYFDLPDTLKPKERRRIHALCADLGLYHAGAGKKDVKSTNTNGDVVTNGSTDGNGDMSPTLKRRIAVSIFADGLQHVPDLESPDDSSSFPSRVCQPWYHHAYGSSTGNMKTDRSPYQQRREAIELEKRIIRQLSVLPEKSLRESDRLDFGILDSLDLSLLPSSEDTPWMLVDTVAKLKRCVDELVYGADGNSGDDAKIHELAFDLEMCAVGEGNSKSVRTCLIQLASDVPMQHNGKEVFKEYVIDPLRVWDAILAHLGPLFADPKIVKIGHGFGGMDSQSLHRDFGILIVNGFDTYECSVILSQRKKGGMGLAHLCHHYGLPNWEHYKQLKHTYQNSDWKRRPLDVDALEYARCDIRYLVTLRKLLMRDLANLAMLGGRHLRFGSSMEDDSDLGSAQGAEELHSFDSQLGGAESNASTSDIDVETSGSNSFDNRQEETRGENGSKDLDVKETIINATELPAYEMLMKAVSISQKRCLKLWTGDDEEAILKNDSLLSLMKQAANQECHWSDANMQLYNQLAEWRVSVAQREFISASEVISLDFCVYVAHRLPRDKWEMRRYSYVLPPLLEDDSLPYCNELCKVVASSGCLSQAKSKSMDAVFYSEANACQQNDEGQRKRLVKLLVATAAVATIFFAMNRVRKR